MNKQNEDHKKIITGLLIGAIGVGALYCLYAAKQRKTPILKKIGRAIADVGEMIENSSFDKAASQVVESIEQKLPDGTDISQGLSELVSRGIAFWNKISK
jgi:hypothetical protein